MDLLFKRYASPFLYIDTMIFNKKLSDFVSFVYEEHHREKEEDQLWNFFLNKVNDKSYADFKSELEIENQQSTINAIDIETTIKQSMEIAKSC